MDSINWSDIYIISHLSLLKVYKKVGIKIKHSKIIKDLRIKNENLEEIQ